MFYPKNLKGKKVSSASVAYSTFKKGIDADTDESVLDVKNAVISYNFFYQNGALTTGYGFAELTVPLIEVPGEFPLHYINDVKFEKIWLFRIYNALSKKRQDKLVMFADDNYMHWVPINRNDNWVYRNSFKAFPSCPTAILYRYNDQDVFIFSSLEEGFYIWNNISDPMKVESAPQITSMCVHYERIFATVGGAEKKTIWFSAEFNPTNWSADGSGSGFIEMIDERGDLNKVISFLDYVYIFREYGISRLTAYADETQFSVSHLFSSSSKIFSDTVAVCDDLVIMLTGNGLYAFDGVNTKKIPLEIEKLLIGADNKKANSVFFKGKYYLACKLNYGDNLDLVETTSDSVNNTLLVYDIEKNSYTITRGVDINSMLALQEGEISKVILCLRGEHANRLVELNETGMYFDTVMPKYWQSPKNDLGYPNKKKLIKEIYLETDYVAKIDVVTDKKVKTYNLKVGKNRIRVNLLSTDFAINFYSETPLARISPPKVFIRMV